MSKERVKQGGIFGAIRRFLEDRKANVAVITGLTIMPLMFLTGMTVDYTNMERIRSDLQQTADSAALFAVQEIRRIGYDRVDLYDRANDALDANYENETESVALQLDSKDQKVTVHMETEYKTAFMPIMGREVVDISVLSQVKYGLTYGEPRCIMALDRDDRGIIAMNGNAQIIAPNCAMHVNSGSDSALDLNGSGTGIQAKEVCVVGGVDSGYNRIQPAPEEDCDPVDDPFDEYAMPAVGGCDYNNHKVKANARTKPLSPGVYCGGIDIASGADLEFLPGLYVIKDGYLKSTGTAKLRGDGVTFFFTGYDVSLDLSGGTDFNFVAMDSGELAGFLFYFDPSATTNRTSNFSGNADTYFEGIMYFGENDVSIDGNGEINQDSGFSVIVADTIILNGNATFYMSIDPTDTSLPVPKDIYEREVTMFISR